MAEHGGYVAEIRELEAKLTAAQQEIERLAELNRGLTRDYNQLLIHSSRESDEWQARAETAEAERDRLSGALRDRHGVIQGPREWKMRAESAEELLRELRAKRRKLREALETTCMYRIREAFAEVLFELSEGVGDTNRPHPQRWEDWLWRLGERIAPPVDEEER